ncbi:hypothetical protein Tco_0499847 [Tanacetum coccineum]
MHRGIAWDMVENLNPQVLPSFEENTPHVTYLDEVEETIGLPIEEISSFDERASTRPFASFSSFGSDLGDERCPKPPSIHSRI